MQIASISNVITTLDRSQIEYYQLGHSVERTHQLACADEVASRMLGRRVRIRRNEDGVPSVPDCELNISISHTDDYMGIVLSKNQLLALDIEIKNRDIDRIIPRFTNTSELTYYRENGVSNEALQIWSVKECLFKAIPVNQVLFKEHLLITEVSGQNSIHVKCEIAHPELRANLSVVSRIFEPLIVSYIDQPSFGHESF